MKKILLLRTYMNVNKSYFPQLLSEPLGLLYVATYIKDDYDVKIYDAVGKYPTKKRETKFENVYEVGATDEQIIKEIKDFDPDVIGVTSQFTTTESAVIKCVKNIKRSFPELKVIIGGRHRSNVLKESKADVMIVGEGESTFKELLDKNFDLSIKGIAYLKDRNIIYNEKRDIIDINEKPIPARDLLDVDYSKIPVTLFWYNLFKKFKLKPFFNKIPFLDNFVFYIINKRSVFNGVQMKRLPTTQLLTSRGCPSNCSFCVVKNVWGRKYRMRDVGNMIKEIEDVVERYNTKHINIVDDNFTISKKRVIEFCNEVREFDLTFNCSGGTYVPSLDEEVLIHMKKAGFNSLCLGIESGNQEVLDNVIRKNQKLSKVKEVINICKALNIITTGYFMFGIPGETMETMNDTLNFILNSGLDRVRVYVCQPFEGSDIYEKYKDCLIENFDPIISYVTSERCFFNTETLKASEVEAFVKKVRSKIKVGNILAR